MLHTNRNALFNVARTNTLVDNDTERRFGHIEDNSRFAMVELVWHSLVDGTINLDVDIVAHLVRDHVCREMDDSSVLAKAAGKHVACARSITMGVRHDERRKIWPKFGVITSCIPLP